MWFSVISAYLKRMDTLQKHFLNEKWGCLRHANVIMMAENIISVALWILWHKIFIIIIIINNICAFLSCK